MSKQEPWDSDERQAESQDDPNADLNHIEEDDAYRESNSPWNEDDEKAFDDE